MQTTFYFQLETQKQKQDSTLNREAFYKARSFAEKADRCICPAKKKGPDSVLPTRP